MSMKAWAATLFAATFSIAWLWGVHIVPSFVGYAVTLQISFLTSIVLFPSRNSVTAMKTWWALSIIMSAVLAVGLIQAARLS